MHLVKFALSSRDQAVSVLSASACFMVATPSSSTTAKSPTRVVIPFVVTCTIYQEPSDSLPFPVSTPPILVCRQDATSLTPTPAKVKRRQILGSRRNSHGGSPPPPPQNAVTSSQADIQPE
ncbi:hypothetical protein BKA70DRAFT_1236958 [Coprinopsis sp. MPI-PUGE-AT-0042]|nr:hypothetical protein BKA70DRAFT_1236958 [Coprinopsis sp. MPI-PUGE-AT-0042]